MRSHADENGVLHVTQCSHFDEDDDDEEVVVAVFVVVGVAAVVVVEEEGDVVEEDWGGAAVEGDSSFASPPTPQPLMQPSTPSCVMSHLQVNLSLQ